MKGKNGTIGTILFHGLLVGLFLFFGFSTPLPLPPEKGIMVNFGNMETGAGNTEPIQSNFSREETSPPPETVKESGKESLMTQDFEEAPSLPARETQKKETKKSTLEKPIREEQGEQKPVEKPREVNKKALFPARNNTGNTGGEGETGKAGNQGNPFGSVNSPNHAQGNSRGNDGISFSLAGRNPLSLPKPAYNYQVEGKVVVEVTVDRTGNVVSANPGVRGSTTLNEYLLSAAKKAALKAKFDTKSNAPAIQKGTITYHFMLQ